MGKSEPKIFKKDETIQQEGETVSGFSLITKGKCCIAKKVNDKQVLLGIMETGELLGEMSFLSNREFKEASCSIVAISEE